MFLAATLFLVLILTLILLTRLKSQMAALVAWIVGTITGNRDDDKNKEEAKKSVNETDKSKSRKTKQKPKKSPTREPAFSTTLTTPIEEVIEETLNELTVETKPSNKPKKRNKTKPKARSSESVNDNRDFSFVKAKSFENFEKSEDTAASPTFVPVKDRRRKAQKSKIDDLPKSTLIEHYHQKRNKQTSVEEFVVVEKPLQKIPSPKDKVIEIVNKESGKTLYLEAKETKKVHAKISYASVASQRFEESLEQLRKQEEEEKLKQVEEETVNGQNCDLQTEELVSEIQSEERRLVDLIEEVIEPIEPNNGTSVDFSVNFQQKKEEISRRFEDFADSSRTTFETTEFIFHEQKVTEIQTNGVSLDEEIVEKKCFGLEHKEQNLTSNVNLNKLLSSEESDVEVIEEEGSLSGSKTSADLHLKVEESDILLKDSGHQRTIGETLRASVETEDTESKIWQELLTEDQDFDVEINQTAAIEDTEIRSDENLREAVTDGRTSRKSSTEDQAVDVKTPIEVEINQTSSVEDTATRSDGNLREAVTVDQNNSENFDSETPIDVGEAINRRNRIETAEDSESKNCGVGPKEIVEKDSSELVPEDQNTEEIEYNTGGEILVRETAEKEIVENFVTAASGEAPEKVVEKDRLSEETGGETTEIQRQEDSEDTTSGEVLIDKEKNQLFESSAEEIEEFSTELEVLADSNTEAIIEESDNNTSIETLEQEITSKVTETNQELIYEYSGGQSLEREAAAETNTKSPTTNPQEDQLDDQINTVDGNLEEIIELENRISAEINQIINNIGEEQSSLEHTEEATSDYKPFKMSSGTQTRVLTLNDKEHQDSTLYRLQKNWILQFRLGPSLLGRKVLLYCNYPKENEEFKRNSYSLMKWHQDEGCNYSDDTALLTEIIVTLSGSFHYYFTYADGDKEVHQGSGFFLVDPVLKHGNDEELPLDCIQCQTVLAKGLGPFDTWENKLRVAKESGYNMIHFTPIQELGASNSSYSLSEQLKVNPIFAKQNGEETSFEDVDKLIKKLRSEWKVSSICDIVLNHTANESEWLKEHPEATYNCQNCPYMRPSYLLDAALHQFSMDVSKGLYEDKGVPVQVTTEEHLNAIRYYLHSDVLAKLKIYELSTCDVSKYVSEFLNLMRNKVPAIEENLNKDEITLKQDPLYRRLASSIDINLAVKLYNVYRHDCFDEETRIKKCAEDFKNKLEAVNKKVMDDVEEHLNVAVENVIAGIRYFRVQHDGPKVREITKKNPLVSRYFTDYGTPKSLKEHEDIMYSDDGRFLMAHNGWVMSSDPLRNFAAPDSNVYIRRELIAWGDSVKLRYGDKPEDCPFLWDHMKTYVELTARIFDGVRLDNCHSTPIPVAEYLLDCARKVKPDLYVVAELFTNSDMTDNIFVNRLGITSLIREAMSAWDSHEQGRLVYRYGGSPVGSFYQPRIRPLVPSIAHALFLDLTHDNPSPVEKRSVFDLLPSTALVNMACCASGSNRGYDELVPHHIHVVDETRQYTEWTDDDNLALGNSRYVTKKSGIIAAKKALNDLHLHLGAEGFDQVYVDQMDPDIVAVTRHCPDTHQSYVLVAFTAFAHPPEDAAYHQRGIKPLRVEGVLDEIVLEATLDRVDTKSSSSKYAKNQSFHKDGKWINGLSEYQVHLKQHIQPENSEIFERVDAGTPNVIHLNFKNFKPGSIAVIKVSLPGDMSDAIKNVRKLISQFCSKENELWKVISQMTLPDLNRALYRCDQEERDEGHGFDTYNIPNFGSLVYAGFQGFMSLLSTIRPNNDLGHPMCANLRDGNWMIEYIWQRLKLDEGTKQLGQWFEENTKSLKSIPRYLVPCYFDVIVTGIYILLLEQSYDLMSEFVKKGSTFVKGLALGSLQFAAYIKSADLPILSPNLSEPKPPLRKNDKGENVQACVTLSAGLPHFAVGYMRNWGRDTFIALRGLFLLTGRYQDARYHILGYAACLRHGLIPNLLDGGRNSRFNCRDAIWWWLHCVKCYTEEAPNGLSILTDKVSRIFPTDDSPAQLPGKVDQLLRDVIQEALSVHFQGLVFRERNAGRQIDEHMSDQGFNNQIGIHPESGFVFGGNSSNCGTWMDKMGSSDKAGNRGKPATPRDGSAIELIGLSKAVVTWLAKLSNEGVYPYSGVERTGKNGVVTKWTFKEWSEKIQNNFEKHFWVNTTPVNGEVRPDLINKRGIYKDCFGASQEWTDFQLRCNFPIAMVVAPELFDPKHAWTALKQAEKYLLGPLGMKTLDPEDWAYNGYYDNSNDSNDHNVAHGFNYHQGPEWVWPVGFYLRAKLLFAAANGELATTLNDTKVVLSKHFVELQTSTWRGLPELTNKDGAYCKDSSRTQAWSMSCILEVLHDLQKIEKDQPLIN